jgi:hypothetical protein
MRLPLLALTVALGGCYFDVDPFADLGVEDLHVVHVSGDGGVCANGFAHAGELAEAETGGASSGWGAATIPATLDMGTATVTLDTTRVAAGSASLRLDTNAGAAGLFYPESRAGSYDLSEQLYVSFAATADDAAATNDPGWQGGEPHVLVVTTENDYYEYVPDTNLLPRTPGAFVRGTVALAGGNGWMRITTGAPDLHAVEYLAFTFTTRGAGFTVWLDDVQVGPNVFDDCAAAIPQ